MTASHPYDAIILGAGAAGMMCALTAGQRGRRILLLDHADEPGKKILISGGGRCNFTNIHTAPDGYRTATAPALVIATGGPSIPKMGATGFAYDLARRFGLKVVEPRPALVPFTLGGEETLFRSLSGVAAEVVARCGKTAFREAALFTHKGLSGPAILQISSYWRHGESIGIDFLPDHRPDWLIEAKRAKPRA